MNCYDCSPVLCIEIMLQATIATVFLLFLSCLRPVRCVEETHVDLLDDSQSEGRQARRIFKYFDLLKKETDDVEACGDGTTESGICQSSFVCSTKKGKNLGASTCDRGICCQYPVKCPSRVSQPCFVKQSGAVIQRERPEEYERIYVFPKIKNVCQVRLDFDIFSIAQPHTLSDCVDEFLQIFGSITVQELKICGENHGQHMYLAYGQGSSSINMTVRIREQSSRYSIRATYIKCNSKRRVPSHCLQRFTEIQDQVRSFNSNRKQLNDQRYTVCVDQLEGMNRIEWRQCTNTSFFISQSYIGEPKIAADCVHDYVDFLGGNRYCGSSLNPGGSPIVISSQPFVLRVNFDGEELHAISFPGFDGTTTNPCISLPAGVSHCLPGGSPPSDTSDICCQEIHPVLGCTCIWSPPAPPNSPTGELPFQLDNFNTGFCLEYTQVS